MLYRQDRLRQKLAKPVQGPGGSWLVTGIAARAGIYLYLNADGTTRRELVDEECLANPANGIATLGRAPLTLQHPTVLVDADNFDEYGVGDVDSQIYVAEGGYVTIKMAVRKATAQDALSQGTVELSPGYLVEVDDTPGEHPVYGAYDSRQVRRQYNHLAIVDAARGGPECRIALDGLDVATSEEIIVEPKTDDTTDDTTDAETAETATTDASATSTPGTEAAPAVTDEVTYESEYTSKSTEETLPDGTKVYTSTSTSTYEVAPDPEMPEGVTPAMVAFIKTLVRECMYEDAAAKATSAPVTDAAPATPVLDAAVVASAVRAGYKVRRSLEDRIDGADITDLSDVEIADRILSKHSDNADGLTDPERIARALTYPATVTILAVQAQTDAAPAPKPPQGGYSRLP